MANRLLNLFLLVVGLSGMTVVGFAQTGAITGTVYDSDGKETLPGANIYQESNPSAGTVTDIDGQFILTKVPVGTQIITVSYAGFETQLVEVTVVQDVPAEIDITLAPAAIMGDVVVITGQALGQAKAINQQLNSDGIANFVSADKMKELPDVNAAEAISRLPGVAINRSGGEGSKVVVRGLDPKFTAISINGVRLPATSGTDRSVDLSLISPELLSGIELFKSPTPDMDGDALGGSINLNVIKAPKERKARVKALGGYNGLAETWSDYKFSGSYSQRLFDGKVGISLNGNAERFNRSGEVTQLGWRDNDTAIIVGSNPVIRDQLGTRLTYNARREARTRQNGSVGIDFNLGDRTESTLLGIYSRTGRDQFNQAERYDVDNGRLVFQPNIRETSIQLFSGSISTRHAFDAFKVEWGAAYSNILGETPYDLELEFFQDPIAFKRSVFQYENVIRPQDFDNFVQRDSTAEYLQRGYINNSSNTEGITSAFADVSVPLKLPGNITAILKVGGKVRLSQRVRSVDEFTNEFGLYLTDNSRFAELGTLPAVGADRSGSRYFSSHNFTTSAATPYKRLDDSDTRLLNTFDENRLRRFRSLYGDTDLFEKSQYSDVGDYSLDENVYAYYGMVKIKVGAKLTLIPGVRVEMSDNTYTGIYADLEGFLGRGELITEVVDRDYTNVLPHLHLKYQLTDWFDIRASYSTTLARPDFNYVVPSTLVSRGGDQTTVDQGNPQLEASVSENLDLYLTAFKGEYGLFSIGAFRKNISDAFYPFVIGLSDSNLVRQYGFPERGFNDARLDTYSNSPDSYVEGIEFDLQSNLNFLPKPLNGLVANVNLSLFRSETTVNGFTTRLENRSTNPRRPRFVTVVEPVQSRVSLLGQASTVFNASLGYDLGKISARVSSSYQGNKITNYEADLTADRNDFDDGFWRFDVALKYKATPALDIMINLNNLSNQQDRDFFRDPRFVTQVETYGATATFGAQYTFFK